MSNFAKKTEEQRQRAWERRKTNEKYYSDMSKLTFTGMVLSQLSLLYTGDINWIAISIGSIMTIIFKIIANNFINQK